MRIGVCSENNNIGFIVEVNEQIEKAKELIRHGFEAWICFSSVEFPTKYFSKEDADWIECCGYFEPTEDLLKRYNIPYKITDIEFDENDELIGNFEDVEWVYC